MRLWVCYFWMLFVLGGCTSPGQTLLFAPERYPLIKPAKLTRQTAPADLPKELHKTVLSSYIVEPGDGLLLLPADLDSPVRLPSDQTVLPDGSIDLGKYGRLDVAGRTIGEIEVMVKEVVLRLTPDAGFIDVRLVNRQSKMFYVLGEVQTPGKFPLNGNETVLDGILVAGGLTDKASVKKVILVRPAPDGCGTVFGVEYTHIVQLGDVSTNYQLLPGDRIYVPSQSWIESLTSHFHHE